LRSSIAFIVFAFALTAAALASQGPGVGAGPTSLLTQVAGTAILGALMAVVAVGLGKLASRRLDRASGTPHA